MQTIDEINKEIERVKVAIGRTGSDFLKRDYQKYLHKLYRKHNKAVSEWRMKKISDHVNIN